jgi:biopolymer transport protein ExbD
MKLKKRNRASFLETCAASDMAFLLIIYFMVIAGFNLTTGFLINLPARDSTRLILREELVRFELDENGKIIHEGEIIDIPETRRIISSAYAENPNIAVILSINKDAVWQEVVSFVEVAQDLNIESFSFAMQRGVP